LSFCPFRLVGTTYVFGVISPSFLKPLNYPPHQARHVLYYNISLEFQPTGGSFRLLVTKMIPLAFGLQVDYQQTIDFKLFKDLSFLQSLEEMVI
jgi:hypothetical protein